MGPTLQLDNFVISILSMVTSISKNRRRSSVDWVGLPLVMIFDMVNFHKWPEYYGGADRFLRSMLMEYFLLLAFLLE